MFWDPGSNLVDRYIHPKILIDSFAGLGFRGRFRQISQVKLSENQSEEFSENFFAFADRYRFNGWDSVPHLTIGIKVGILTGDLDGMD